MRAKVPAREHADGEATQIHFPDRRPHVARDAADLQREASCWLRM